MGPTLHPVGSEVLCAFAKRVACVTAVTQTLELPFPVLIKTGTNTNCECV